MAVIEWFFRGGIVMYPMLLLSLISLAIIIERILYWTRLLPRQKAFVEQAFADERWQPEQLRKLINENADIPLGRIFGSALSIKTDDETAFRLALEGAAKGEIPKLKRFVSVLDTIVTLSPLLGLLGTVLGLINSFASLGLGTENSSKGLEVAGGISEALIATATGMIVALVTLIFASTFRALARRQVTLMETAGTQLELRWRMAGGRALSNVS
ncbi:MotA/TolQ/ExbB proton channel family protein [Gloeobacter kilaueensis]|uniref:Biopolymer transport protein ExbB n=1 Tax=Gloeobacter kilaueensis (strain ATCC BAA-2537 / CCAP 1431/1 / ULC 316 / JS1) TaxID=1183438 RepID=U5QG37_GLOK1|nr:MotA/TolQ/ExbB proton channel family protein [Gloeobacter kilaueensis]AGY57818.1 biopolymer transport protein ExbB [Gloeobacter kilaueensis JS1]AGY58948.1 biopolymer transport protein ExbB [Gloeobacter kilaueensis JS1]